MSTRIPSLFAVAMLMLGSTLAALPATFQLFSGAINIPSLTVEDFSELCGRPGIQCDTSGGIVMIDGPELTDEVRSLSDLEYMPRLKSLNLKGLGLTMLFPTEICTLEHLQYLDLSENNFVGTIPPCICNLAYLKYADLSNNRLQGGLPECANGMTSLQDINLSCNVMEEPLPESINYISTIEGVNYTCNDYKQYQAEITVAEYKAGDINCSRCIQHPGTCPEELSQYGSGTYAQSE